MGIAILGMMFLFLGHINAYPSVMGGFGYTTYDQEYGDYTKAVRVKIGNIMSKHLDIAQEGTVSLKFEISSDGKLIQVSVNIDKTKASQKMIDMAIQAVKESSPFGAFPDELAKNNKLPFSIDLSFKPAPNAQL
jgi:outer membrane biosynthesis protein TonB